MVLDPIFKSKIPPFVVRLLVVLLLRVK